MKPLQVYWNGEKMCKIYPFATRWEVFKFKVRRFLRRVMQATVIASVASSFIVGAYVSGQMSKNNEIFAISTDSLPAKLDDLKNDLVRRLSVDCEIKGKKETDDLITFDSNRVASLGVMQFQIKTVIFYENMLYGKNITGSEAVEIANNPVQARALAKDVIFKTENGVAKDWTNCSRKYNLQSEVDLIKKLEK